MRLVWSESSRAVISLAVGSLARMSCPASREISLCAMRNSTFWRVWDTICANKAEGSGGMVREAETGSGVVYGQGHL